MSNKKSKNHDILNRGRWPQYLAGMVTETAFILGLAGFALLMAVIAKMVWR